MFRKKIQVDSSRIAQALKPVEAAKPVQQQNLRRSPRSDSWHTCAIRGVGGFRISAVMVDHGKGGARVRFRSHEALPKQVVLIVPARGIDRACTVAWCKKGDAGLQFT